MRLSLSSSKKSRRNSLKMMPNLKSRIKEMKALRLALYFQHSNWNNQFSKKKEKRVHI